MCTRMACAASSSWGVLEAAREAHICRQHTATSRRDERRAATDRPSGPAKATVCINSGGALTRLRSSGAAMAAATIPQAVALMARDRRTGRGVYRALLAYERAGTACGGLHERADDRAALVGLGVPLHAQHEATIGWPGGLAPIHLDRLGQLVDGRAAADEQPRAETVDSLVMMRSGRVDKLAAGARGERALAEQHVVLGAVEGAQHAPVLFMAEQVGQMLQEGASERDVDQLHAAADAQHRHVALDGSARERYLEGISLGDRVNRVRPGLLAIGGGVDVGAACEQQAVDQIEYLLRVLGRTRVGREHHGQAAGALHRLYVAEPEQRGGLLPHAPARLLERGAHADHRTCHASNHRIKASRTARRRRIGRLRASREETAWANRTCSSRRSTCAASRA